MNWGGLADFVAMDGDGLYVWSAYAATVVALAWEAVVLVQRRLRVMQDLRDAAGLAPHQPLEA